MSGRGHTLQTQNRPVSSVPGGLAEDSLALGRDTEYFLNAGIPGREPPRQHKIWQLREARPTKIFNGTPQKYSGSPKNGKELTTRDVFHAYVDIVVVLRDAINLNNKRMVNVE